MRLAWSLPSPAKRGAEAGFREAEASRRRSDARLPARGYVRVGAERGGCLRKMRTRVTPPTPALPREAGEGILACRGKDRGGVRVKERRATPRASRTSSRCLLRR